MRLDLDKKPAARKLASHLAGAALGGIAVISFLAGCTPGESDPDQAKPVRKPEPHLVEVTVAQPADVSLATQRTGSLIYRRSLEVFNQEEGKLVEVRKFEGDRFKRDEILIQIEDDLLRAQLSKAQASTRQAQLDLKRIRSLAKKRAASEDELAQAQTAVQIAKADQQLLQSRLGYTRITAPFDGLVTQRKLEPGAVVAKHTHLLTIADPSSLMIELPVSELLLPLIRLNDRAKVRIDALGTSQFDGKIARIHPELDPITRRGLIEVALDPIPDGARAGQFARVTLQAATVQRLLIPFNALRRDREHEFVYLMTDNKADKAIVRSGIRIGDQVEIVEGINTGDEIITRGFLGLSPGKSVALANSTQASMTPARQAMKP